MNSISPLPRASTPPAPRQETADPVLFSRIAAGDIAALGLLYDRYHEDVRHFVARVTSNGADVDDLVHDAFLTASRIAGRYDGRPSARPFLLGIAAQLVHRRRRTVGRLARAMQALSGIVAPPTPTPEQQAGAAEERRRFVAALAGLSDDKRLAFVLFEREGLSGEEIAEALEIPVNTVWTRLHHARADLRRALGASRAGGGNE